jgi:hypothetical protein
MIGVKQEVTRQPLSTAPMQNIMDVIQLREMGSIYGEKEDSLSVVN